MTDRDRLQCARCGAVDAPPPDGWAVFARRCVLARAGDREMCGRCYSIGTWHQWRLLAALIGVVCLVGAIWQLDVLIAMAVPAAGFWWWFASHAIAVLEEDAPAAPDRRA